MAKRTPPPEPELTLAQEIVIDQLLAGATDAEAATAAGVTVKEIAAWRASNALFIATTNARRKAIFDARAERFRSLLPKAIDVLEKRIDSADEKVSMTAAMHVLKVCGMTELKPSGETDPENIEETWRSNEMFRSLRSVF